MQVVRTKLPLGLTPPVKKLLTFSVPGPFHFHSLFFSHEIHNDETAANGSRIDVFLELAGLSNGERETQVDILVVQAGYDISDMDKKYDLNFLGDEPWKLDQERLFFYGARPKKSGIVLASADVKARA